jgi:type II secretory pathway component PulF
MARKIERHHNKNSKYKIGRSISVFRVGIGRELNYFTENLSLLVASGMTVISAIDAIIDDVRTSSLKNILVQLREDIENGMPLWKALEKSGIFRDHTISLVRVGEESGRLSENLKLIAAQEEKDRAFRSKVRSAMMYPVFVLMLTAIVGVAIAWFILPRLAVVFTQLRMELPALTKILIMSGEFATNYGLIVFPSFLVFLALVVFFVFYFSKTRFIGQAILSSIPGVRKLLQEVELTRFGYILGTLLQAGVPINQALDSLVGATSSPRYQRFYAYLSEGIREGNSFSKNFTGYKKSYLLIPVPIQQLIVSGEQSGNLSDTLIKISAIFESRLENTTKNLSVILEPVLLVIVWLGVVAVALAVILPIYNLIGGLNADSNQEVDEGVSNSSNESVVMPINTNSVIIDLEATSSSENLSEDVSDLIIEVLPTGLGYLNVRDLGSFTGIVIGRVVPGQRYEYLEENNGWYKILINQNESGWVFGEYVKIIE